MRVPSASLLATLAAVILLAAMPTPARSALTQAQIDNVGVSRKVGTLLPGTLSFRGTGGRDSTLSSWLGNKPGVIIFADYQCKMVCDAALGVFARVLEELPASAKGNFRALVIGLDPNDTPAIAQQARNRHFEPDRSAAKDPAFLVGSANAVKRLAKAVGYRYAYDPERGEFAHPVIVIVVDADKRITRYLPLLGMSGTDLQLALNDAGAPATGFAQAVRALCYRFDPATGLYTPAIETILTVACGATVAAMLVGFALLRSRTRQSSLSDAGGKRG